MSELSLSELLDSVGINKTILAKLMDVSRQTVARMGDSVSPEVLECIDKYKESMTHAQSEAVPVPVRNDQPKNVVHGYLPVTHRNIALSVTWHDLDRLAVARRFDMSRFEYNQAVQDAVSHCNKTNTTFKELRL